MPRSSLFLPLFLIIAGSVWFLKTTDILPATSTMISGGMVLAGIAVIVADGINKQSIVSGPLLAYIGTATYLYSHYFLALSPLVAAGMVILGCLLLLSRSNMIPDKQDR